MLAHRSQLWAVPDGMDDRTAVLIEPLACAIHSVFRAHVPDGADVLVIGAGTVGILTLIALRRFASPGRVIVGGQAHAPAGRRADGRCRRGGSARARPEGRAPHGHAVKLTPERGQDFLLGGADVVFECTGSKQRARHGAAHAPRRAGAWS